MMTADNTSGRFAAVFAISLILVFGACLPSVAQEMPSEDDGSDTGSACYQCHSKKEITPWIAETWAKSTHAAAGVKCSDCHGSHDEGFDSQKFTALPGPETCRNCHPIKVKETLAGMHAGATKCTSCHPRHTFSLRVAQNPMICVTCHTDKHSQGYSNSKMGVIYATEGPGSAATCQTCHMPAGIHDVNRTIDSREGMLKVCNNCHSASFAGDVLKNGKFDRHW